MPGTNNDTSAGKGDFDKNILENLPFEVLNLCLFIFQNLPFSLRQTVDLAGSGYHVDS